MNFTVLWTPTAEQDLAAVWLGAADPNAVALASDRIERLLRIDPQTRGVPDFDTVRRMTIDPLGAQFEVIEDDRVVYILTVWDVNQAP